MSAECQEMTESHSKHSQTEPAGAGREVAGNIAGGIGKQGGGKKEEVLGSHGLAKISSTGSLPVGNAVGVLCVSPL